MRRFSSNFPHCSPAYYTQRNCRYYLTLHDPGLCTRTFLCFPTASGNFITLGIDTGIFMCIYAILIQGTRGSVSIAHYYCYRFLYACAVAIIIIFYRVSCKRFLVRPSPVPPDRSGRPFTLGHDVERSACSYNIIRCQRLDYCSRFCFLCEQ